MLTSVRNEVITLSGTDMAVTAANEMLAAYRQLDTVPSTPAMREAVRQFYTTEFEPALARHTAVTPTAGRLPADHACGWYLHYHYMANGRHPYGPRRRLASSTDTSPFAAALARQRHLLGPSLDRLGFENVMLVDPVDARSVLQLRAIDDLRHQPARAGPMRRPAWPRSRGAADDRRTRTTTGLADFESFRPALGQPKAFIASPVFDGPRLVAIMVLRFPIEPIAQALSNDGGWEAEGLGKTGQVYLVRSRHDHARGLALPDRGPGDVPRDAPSTPG